MAKVNVFDLDRPYASKTETKSFVEPLQGGREFTFTLRGLTPAEQFAALDYANGLIARYVGSDSEPATHKLPAVGGKIPTPSRLICLLLAQLVYAQEGPDEDKYSFEEMVAIAETCPNVITQVQSWSEKLLPPSDPKGRRASGTSSQK